MSVKTNKSKTCEEIASSFLEHCQMTNDEVKRVEIETRGQSGNKMWFDQREGKNTYTPLVFDILNKSDDISHLPQIKWGLEHEKDAIK